MGKDFFKRKYIQLLDDTSFSRVVVACTEDGGSSQSGLVTLIAFNQSIKHTGNQSINQSIKM